MFCVLFLVVVLDFNLNVAMSFLNVYDHSDANNSSHQFSLRVMKLSFNTVRKKQILYFDPIKLSISCMNS